MTSNDAVTALRRFGLGARSGEPARIASDPRGFVLSQIDPDRLPEIGGLPTSALLWQQSERYRIAHLKAEAGGGNAMDGGMDGGMGGGLELVSPDAMAHAEIAARVQFALTTELHLLERLAGFWANHFTIAIQGWLVRSMAGAYERETIRPLVLGRFRDMLHAVVRHPAMLVYLDGRHSIGPNSTYGRSSGQGLNENLAREILELHTVGVNGGYGQDDVSNLARALTGWSVYGGGAAEGTFRFIPEWHEPGAVSVMGRTYPEGGVEQAEAVLDDLAAHPATARHVARKVAVHFVSEKAPVSLVDRLAAEFRQSDGDLAALTRVLVSAEDAWLAEPRKMLPPYDFVIAAFRALERTPDFTVVSTALHHFGQLFWRALSPAGWPDGDEAWASPHAVVERLDWVTRVAMHASQSVGRDVPAFADGLFPDALSDFTRQSIARAETREQAIALMFMSPEFQRR